MKVGIPQVAFVLCMLVAFSSFNGGLTPVLAATASKKKKTGKVKSTRSKKQTKSRNKKGRSTKSRKVQKKRVARIEAQALTSKKVGVPAQGIGSYTLRIAELPTLSKKVPVSSTSLPVTETEAVVVVPVEPDDDEAEGPPEDDGTCVVCKHLDRNTKLRQAMGRSKAPYAATYQIIRTTPGMVRLEQSKQIELAKSVLKERVCKYKKGWIKRCKRCKRRRALIPHCHWIEKPRNYLTPVGRDFLVYLASKLSVLKGGPIKITSLTRDHAKQNQLRLQGYPTAPLDDNGRFLSDHTVFGGADLSKHLPEVCINFIKQRLVVPFEHLEPKDKPIIAYFEKGRGSLHFSLPATPEDLQTVKMFMDAKESELQFLIASYRQTRRMQQAKG